MTIKQQGGVFGRHPEFSTVEIDGVGTLKKNGSNLEIIATSGVKISGPSFWGMDVDGGLRVQDDLFRLIRNANTSYVDIGVDATSAYLRSTYSSGGTSDFRFLHNSSEIMRITGNGITFNGDTAAANALDDYEEGTWTPSDGSAAGLSLTVNNAKYTKIGRVVSIEADIAYPVTADGSAARLSGLPYNENYYGVGPIITNAAVDINAWVNGGGKITFLTSAASFIPNSDLSGKYVRISVQYFA